MGATVKLTNDSQENRARYARKKRVKARRAARRELQRYMDNRVLEVMS